MICGWCNKPVGLYHPCAWGTPARPPAPPPPPLIERARQALMMWEAGYGVGLDRGNPPLVIELAREYIKTKEG